MAPRRFLSLPAEIQNIIYEHALQQEEGIAIVRPIDLKNKHKLWTGNTMFCSPELLRTCKKIHNDATPVFYGSNKFITKATVICDFVQRIGSSVRYIRFLDIMFLGSCVGIKRTMRTLRAAHGLNRLTIIKVPGSTMTQPGDMAAALLPWAKAQYRRTAHRTRDESEVRKIVDVVDIVPDILGLVLRSCHLETFMTGGKDSFGRYNEDVKGQLMDLLSGGPKLHEEKDGHRCIGSASEDGVKIDEKEN